MNAPAPMYNESFDVSLGGLGPIEHAIDKALNERFAYSFEIRVMEQSPVGFYGVRIRPTEAILLSLNDVSRWLSEQEWVQAVIPRPAHVYIQLQVDALRCWIVDAFRRLNHGYETSEGTPPINVNVNPSSDPLHNPLAAYRNLVIANALVALLNGNNAFNHITASSSFRVHRDTPLGRQKFARCSIPKAVSVSVAPVDVAHGALRARHGGTLSCEDLKAELRMLLPSQADNAVCEGYYEAALAFLFLRVERSHRFRLNEERLSSEAKAFAKIAAARTQFPGQSSCDALNECVSAGRENAIRELATKTSRLFSVVARAATCLEPALLARYLRSLADSVWEGVRHLPDSDPLFAAGRQAIDASFSFLGLFRNTARQRSP